MVEHAKLWRANIHCRQLWRENKNMCVVRFLMCLVETKIFQKFNLVLLVKGHTKKSANCMFNLLKLTHHCWYISIYHELHTILSENEFVNAIKIPPSKFHDHLKWKDQHYRVPEKGYLNTRNVFYISVLNQGSQLKMLMSILK